MENTLELALDKYVKDKHTQEECIGFIDGFNVRNNDLVNICNKLVNIYNLEVFSDSKDKTTQEKLSLLIKEIKSSLK